ncbi:uncharacterized protein EV154DRAFT_429441 [Mucor mucedo]|uniref:uncharacterized protein n=1 Tax=Mucor mucedo TaxID=29922 RepID=UPI002220E482|nr:uncharacterized protein EV154DRAFT_429441 [Mucor mucedo]KAI7877294.1 hypothetical protein EV154DRAFT_429441 [Mucor mucedo]
MEHRAALTPATAKQLIKAGFQITVEESDQRIFDDHEYAEVGCTMVPFGSWKEKAPSDAYIIGLKELPENDTSPLHHTHIFFAHCFKNQAGWKEILHRFKDSGKILDLEFLQDAQGRRVAAFGFMAGFAGAAVSLDVWCHQKKGLKMGALKPFQNEQALIDYAKGNLRETLLHEGRHDNYPTLMVMGARGRCGSGAVDFAKKVGLPAENIIQWDMEETKKGGPFPEIMKADIFVNCIYLNQKIPPFMTQEMIDSDGRQLTVICDVSCDTTNPNNPIPVYSVNTTFDQPTVRVKTSSKRPLDVISIDHLPTLLPRESSNMFSQDLLPTLMELKDIESSSVWQRAQRLFYEKLHLATLTNKL